MVSFDHLSSVSVGSLRAARAISARHSSAMSVCLFLVIVITKSLASSRGALPPSEYATRALLCDGYTPTKLWPSDLFAIWSKPTRRGSGSLIFFPSKRSSLLSSQRERRRGWSHPYSYEGR